MNGRVLWGFGGPGPRRWRMVWSWLAVVPAVLAVVSLPTPLVMATVVVGFCFAATIRLVVEGGRRGGRVTRARLRRALGTGAQVALAFLGLVEVLTFSTWLGLAVIAVAAVTGVIAHRPRADIDETHAVLDREVVRPDEQVLPLPAVVADVRALDDSELCHAWRHSFVTLERAKDIAERARVVEARQAMLDELARRHPEGLRAWLDAGGRAAGGPERFIGRRDDGEARSEVA